MWIIDWLPVVVLHLIALAGLAGVVVSFLLGSLIPAQYKLVAQVGSVIVLAFGLYLEGGMSNEDKWQLKVKEMQAEIAKTEKEGAEASVKVVTKYVDRVQIVKEKGDAIVQKIPEYISKDADAKCPIPNGFVVLHDAAAKGEVPDSTRDVNEATSRVALSTVGKTVTENYTICHQTEEQLKSLQEWVRTQEKIYNGD
jgi:predicted transcriptional regulator